MTNTSNLSALEIVIISREQLELNTSGLPTLTAYESNGNFVITEGMEVIKSAIATSLRYRYLGEPRSVVIFLAVNLRPASQRRRRLG